MIFKFSLLSMSMPLLGIDLVVERIACFNEVRSFSSCECMRTGRCNHEGQACTEEPDQEITTLPSGWAIELKPPSLLRDVEGN